MAPVPAPPAAVALLSRARAKLRGTRPVVVVLGVAILLVPGAGEWATREEMENQWDNLRRSAEVQALALRGVATRYSYLPFTAAQQPVVKDLLRNPGSASTR